MKALGVLLWKQRFDTNEVISCILKSIPVNRALAHMSYERTNNINTLRLASSTAYSGGELASSLLMPPMSWTCGSTSTANGEHEHLTAEEEVAQRTHVFRPTGPKLLHANLAICVEVDVLAQVLRLVMAVLTSVYTKSRSVMSTWRHCGASPYPSTHLWAATNYT